MSVWFVLVFTVCVTCGSVNKIVCISLFGSPLQWEWEYVVRRSVVSVRVCERASVFSSCRYMCTTSVSSYLLSSVCFKWHMQWNSTSTSEEQTSNQTLTGFFSGYQGRSIVVILNKNARNLTLKGTLHEDARDNCLFQCECLSLAISSLPLNLKWGTGRRPGYNSIETHTGNFILNTFQNGKPVQFYQERCWVVVARCQ